MGMRAMEDLKDMLCKELDEIAKKGELTAGSLETVHKLTDTIKNIDKIMMLEDEDGEYSERGYSRDGGYSMERGGNHGGYSRAGEWEARGGYGMGHSYAQRRDSRGRYSRDDGKEHMMREMEGMLEDADGKSRTIIQRALDELRRA